MKVDAPRTRLFFGVELPLPLKEQLAGLQAQLREEGLAAGNWTDKELFHLTVLFLGELPASAMAQLDTVGAAGSQEVSPFTLTLSSVGTFTRNRILWMGIRSDDGFRQLTMLHRAVSREMASTNLISLETRPYKAHVTLARKLDVQSLPASGWQAATDISPGGQSFVVKHLALFESKRGDGRLVYPVIRRFPLNGVDEQGVTDT